MNTSILPANEKLELLAKSKDELPAVESSVVRQFVETSKEIIPGLEVSLAKRVVLPGSRRILSMAAHTSIPLRDDEISSVSELALRLSDGTSCFLSLQFFNDTVSGAYVPYRSFPYDPERYNTIDKRSNLGIFILGAILVGFFSFYQLAAFNFRRSHSQPVLRTVHSSFARAPVKPTFKTAVLASKRLSTGTTRPSYKKHMVKDNRTNKEKIGLARMGAFKAGHGKSEAFFVPPPPPVVFTWPAPRPFSASADRAPLAARAVQSGKSVVAEKEFARSDSAQDLLPAVPAKPTRKAVPEPSTQIDRAPELEHISPSSPALHRSAPIPGNDNAQGLERISLPH